ncbi:MAG: hypothetical protein V2A62_00060 [Candidatus Woesearchaeota archaeon]
MALLDSLGPFEKGMSRAAEIFIGSKPDIILAPMMGSVPFIDCMHIVNEEFETDKVYYMPASSGIENIQQIMRLWMANFLDEIARLDQPVRIMGIDEVVSGNSSLRVHKAITEEVDKKKRDSITRILNGFNIYDSTAFQKAASDFDGWTGYRHHDFLENLVQEQMTGLAERMERVRELRRDLLTRIKEYTRGLLSYKSIGIEDAKAEGKRNRQYLQLVESGLIIPVGVEAIVSMDKPNLCPAKYKKIADKSEVIRYSPIVEGFVVTPQYLDFLHNIATLSGKNPEQVSPVNLNRILESSKYLTSRC